METTGSRRRKDVPRKAVQVSVSKEVALDQRARDE